MKANELMIGDYLKWNGKPYRVAQVSTPTVAGDLYDGWMLENGEEDCGEPIPITPEILEKNGWVYIAEDKVFYSENFKGELPWIYYITDGNNEVFRMKDFCNLQYVHQLQHALRLCGIEKEIEL